jgi:hypothetical protein
MSWEITLQTNWRCAGGVTITDLGVVDSAAVWHESVDGQSSLVVPLDIDYYDVCRRNAVVFVIDDTGRWAEFRINSLAKQAGAAGFTLSALPPIYDLAAADLVREVASGRVITAFTEQRTMADLIATRVLGNAAADNLTHFAPGTIEFSEILDLTWARMTPAKLLRYGLDVLKRGELRVRADGFDAYRIDVLAQIGAELPVVPLRFGDMLTTAADDQEFDGLYTAIRVVGEAPTADAEPATFDDNVYTVDSVTAIGPGGVGPFAVALVDPASGVSPVQMDGVFARDVNGLVPACWLQLASGNRTEILDSRAASGDVVVAIAPTVGDRVVIVQTADGAPLERLTWPAAVAQYGLIVADARVSGGRGERNYIVNPGFDGAAAEYTTGIGGYTTRIPRAAVGDYAGQMAATKSPGAPASFAVDGFAAGLEVKRGSIVDVTGAEFTTTADAFIDENGDGVLPVTPTLPANIPAGTQMVSDAVAYLLARGAANLLGDADIDVNVPGGGTRAWAADDELTFTVTVPLTRTLSGASDTKSQFVTFDLATPFSRDIPVGAVLTWTHAPISRQLTVTTPYTSGDPTITVRHPTWTPFLALRGEVQPLGLAGETVTHTALVTSRHTVTNSPTWNTAGVASVVVSPALPIDMPAALTAVRWDRVDAAAFVGNVELTADQTATATAFSVRALGGLVVAIPSGTVLRLVGESFTVNTDVTLDGSGAGTVAVVAAPTTTLLNNAAVRITHNTDWFNDDRGGEHVAMVEGTLAVDETAPDVVDVCTHSQPFRVVLPPGATAQVFARVPLTFYSPARTNSTQRYGAAKIALVNLDTNAVVAWAGSQPENADALTAPDNARLPLTWNAAAKTWEPLHVALSCNAVFTETARCELRYYGPIGLSSTVYARTYVRWSSVWRAGAIDAIPYVNGSRGDDLLLTGAQLLLRDARPAVTYTVTLDAFSPLDIAAAGLPANVLPTVELGGRVQLEHDDTTLRVLSFDRRPNQAISAVTVGTRPPSAALTLAAVAQVSAVGGVR